MAMSLDDFNRALVECKRNKMQHKERRYEFINFVSDKWIKSLYGKIRTNALDTVISIENEYIWVNDKHDCLTSDEFKIAYRIFKEKVKDAYPWFKGVYRTQDKIIIYLPNYKGQPWLSATIYYLLSC